MYEYTLSFSWSVVADHKNILAKARETIYKQLSSTEEWFAYILGTTDEMSYWFAGPRELIVICMEHSLSSEKASTVISLQSPVALDSEKQESILFQVRERLLSYTYCPFGYIIARPEVHSEVISLDLNKASLPLVK
jgi:hypothetical protein